MEALRSLEILWILFIQSLGDWLAEPMRIISLLGNEEFYMLVMPVLYWSVSARLGLRVAVMLLLSNGLGTVLKLAFHLPRPYWVSDSVQALSEETSFGMPSGHAMNAAGIWGLLAAGTRGTAGKALLVLVIFLIGFSRIYLGVHFITDVLAGWALGGLLLFAFLKIERPLAGWLRDRSLKQMVLLACASTVVLGSSILLSAAALGSWELPETWRQAALTASPGNEIDPLNLDSAFTLSGTWLGMLLGAAWLYHRQGGFQAAGSPAQRLARYAIGLVGVFALWFGLGQLLPREADLTSYLLRFARYTLVGLWIAALAPLLFERLGLVQPRQRVVGPSSAL